MAMEVLLINQVEGLGIEGDVVKVSDGYARNFLFPKGYAAEITEGLRRQVEQKRIQRIKQLEEEKLVAIDIASQIEKIECKKILVKVGENGKMFGSVGIPLLVSHLEEEGIKIERNKVKLHSPINELGSFDIIINLHPEVEAVFKVEIIAEK